MSKAGLKDHGVDSAEFENIHNRKKPPPFNLRKFLYNSEQGLIMGRNGASWCKFDNDRVGVVNFFQG